jgi:hypothetical protein
MSKIFPVLYSRTAANRGRGGDERGRERLDRGGGGRRRGREAKGKGRDIGEREGGEGRGTGREKLGHSDQVCATESKWYAVWLNGVYRLRRL